MSPSWPIRSAGPSWGTPPRVTATTRAPVSASRSARRRRQGALDEPDPPARVCPLDRAALGKEPAQHLLGRPGDRRDGRYAEALVDLGAPWVVDARDDVGDLVGLARDAGAQHVGVVAARHRGERARPRRPRLLEAVAVEAGTEDLRAGPVLREA